MNFTFKYQFRTFTNGGAHDYYTVNPWKWQVWSSDSKEPSMLKSDSSRNEDSHAVVAPTRGVVGR